MANIAETVSDSGDIFARAARPSLLALPCKSPAHDKARRRLCPLSLQASKMFHEVASMNLFSCVYVSYRLHCMSAEQEGTVTQPEGAFSRLAPVCPPLKASLVIMALFRKAFVRRSTERNGSSSFHHPSNGKWTVAVKIMITQLQH